MAVRALKQTGSRNIEAALEYISKMGYLDPRNERIVHVIKQTSPGTVKATVDPNTYNKQYMCTLYTLTINNLIHI